MWAPRSASRSRAQVSVLKATESMISVSEASWPPPGAASEVGGGMSAGVVCTPVSVNRDAAGGGIGERTEDAL